MASESKDRDEFVVDMGTKEGQAMFANPVLMQRNAALHADRVRIKRLGEMRFGAGKDLVWSGNELKVVEWVKGQIAKCDAFMENLPVMKKFNGCLSAVANRMFQLQKPGAVPNVDELKKLEILAMNQAFEPLPETDSLVIAMMEAVQESRADRMMQRMGIFLAYQNDIEDLATDDLHELTSEFARVVSEIKETMHKAIGDTTIDWWVVDS
ncbi:MAG: hypothetical protein Hyperionvirus16_45 [Hyperionvirus sp.]|uniref:Uncharacterized protein n=1 Tax=Hyperionvirus sp. TaxID=2487770 RepID=A0A3G5A9Z2_9VIRU|nr:MAG: hypothetical protein Hyperionvirus16_45 [Hyperionvirus sp.]